MPILSVIIPVYNSEKYLKKCLDSVLNQTLDNVEIIIVNDGSTDSSKSILDEYALKNSNICIIDKCNEGVAIARNLGISIATGKYITFLDSDDYVDNKMYEQMINKIEMEDADIIQCGVEFINQNTENTIGYLTNGDLLLDKTEAMKLFINLKIPGYTWNKIYKRSLFIENDIQYPEVFCYEDMAVVLKALLNCNKFISVNNCYYKYRKVDDSLSNKISDYHIIAYNSQIKYWLDILKNNEKNNMNENIIPFNVHTFMTSVNWYIKMQDFDRKEIYNNFEKYFEDIKPNINIIQCLLNKNISRGFKLTYLLWKIKVYDLFIKYRIL